ncbi:hypothetical protein [Streptomyces sp. NPDC006879]|uniref:hypothetical protein n=1 Tax=Streptomyces sp. NPDC006879 TaxID=3364767 RepID=UPI0036B4F4EF
MAGSSPFRKRRYRKQGSPEAYEGFPGPPQGLEAPLEGTAGLSSLPEVTGTEQEPRRTPGARRQQAAQAAHTVKNGVRKSGEGARVAIAYLADRLIENAPRVPVRDLGTLRRQFPGLDPDQLADKLIAGAVMATSTVGAGVGAAAMLPVPPAMPAELAAEITAVAAIELKLIAELHEVYGQRPQGKLIARSHAYLTAWTEERGIDVARPATVNAALGSQFKRELRQQIMKRMVRNLPNLTPFMIGAAVGAALNRRDTKKIAEKVRADLLRGAVPWHALPQLPPLERPRAPLDARTVDPRAVEGPWHLG